MSELEAKSLAAAENSNIKNESVVKEESPQGKVTGGEGTSPEVKVSKKDETRGAVSKASKPAQSKETAKETAKAKAATLQARNQSYVQKMLSLPKLVFTEQVEKIFHSCLVSYICFCFCFVFIFLYFVAVLFCFDVFLIKMLRFMLQDGVAEILVSFITQIRDDDEPFARPVRGGALTEELKKSYR